MHISRYTSIGEKPRRPGLSPTKGKGGGAERCGRAAEQAGEHVAGQECLDTNAECQPKHQGLPDGLR
jgi:hypothetical protein